MTPSPFQHPTLRDDLPRYPPLLQMLRVTAATVAGPSGVAQTAGSSVLAGIYYVAFTQQRRTDSGLPRDREPCLVHDVNGIGLTSGFYNGRLAGSHNSLPVYEVTDRAGSTVAATFSGARVYRVDTVIQLVADYVIEFDNEQWDTDGYHDNVTNNTRLTVPTTGYYAAGCNIAISDNIAILHSVSIRLNGVTSIGHWQQIEAATGEINHCCIVSPWLFNAGDYVEVVVENPTFANVYALVSTEPVFWIYRLGT